MMSRKFLMCISVFVLVFLGFYCNSQPTKDQGSADAETMIRAVADGVLKDATFHFIDQTRGKRFTSPEQAPSDTQLRPESSYTDWRYWNGVLNIAMIKVGKALNAPTYSEFARKNVAFSFDNYRYFEKKCKGEDKWNYPFGQFLILVYYYRRPTPLNDVHGIGAVL